MEGREESHHRIWCGRVFFLECCKKLWKGDVLGDVSGRWKQMRVALSPSLEKRSHLTPPRFHLVS